MADDSAPVVVSKKFLRRCRARKIFEDNKYRRMSHSLLQPQKHVRRPRVLQFSTTKEPNHQAGAAASYNSLDLLHSDHLLDENAPHLPIHHADQEHWTLDQLLTLPARKRLRKLAKVLKGWWSPYPGLTFHSSKVNIRAVLTRREKLTLGDFKVSPHNELSSKTFKVIPYLKSQVGRTQCLFSDSGIQPHKIKPSTKGDDSEDEVDNYESSDDDEGLNNRFWRKPPHIPKKSRIRRILTNKFIRSQKSQSKSFVSETWRVHVLERTTERQDQETNHWEKNDQKHNPEEGQATLRKGLTLGDFWPPEDARRLGIQADDRGGVDTDDAGFVSGESGYKIDDDNALVTMPTLRPPEVESKMNQSVSSAFSDNMSVKTAGKSLENSLESELGKVEENESPSSVSEGKPEVGDVFSDEKANDYGQSDPEEKKRLSEKESFYARVKLDRTKIRPDQLKAEFRRDYREASCKPRRFVINISRIVYHRVALLNKLRSWRMSKTDLTTYLVFAFTRQLGDSLDEYRAWVSSTWTSQLGVNDIFGSFAQSDAEASIGELIQRVVTAVDSVDISDFRSGNSSTGSRHSTQTRPVCSFFMLASMTKWNNGSFQLPHATEWFDTNAMLRNLRDILESETDLNYLQHDLSEALHDDRQHYNLKESKMAPNKYGSRVANLNEILNDSNLHPFLEDSGTATDRNGNSSVEDLSAPEGRGPNSPTICAICLSNLSGSRAGAGSFPLALQLCSHWFCEQCWNYWVARKSKTRDKNNSKNDNNNKNNKNKSDGYLKCLKKTCVTPIEHATLLTLLDLQHIRSFNRSKTDNFLLSLSYTKQCPNPHCERILYSKPSASSKTDHLSFVTCKCSWQVCLACLQLPHWPASCEAASRYQHFLHTQTLDVLKRPLEDHELPDIILRGKHCPKCGQFRQTTRTSKSEHCECGCRFCVPCGQELRNGRSEEHNACQERFVLNDARFKKNLLSQEQKAADVNASKWYAMAMEHRILRHPQVVSALYSMSDLVATKIQDAAREGFHIGDAKKVAAGWREKLFYWNEENERLMGTRSLKRSSLSGNASRPLSRTFSSLSNDSACSLSDTEDVPLDDVIRKAAQNLTHVTLELHHVLEFTCVLLDEQPACHVPLATHMERGEDVCAGLAILLQESHVHNANRILPAFLRLQVKAKQVWGNIMNLIEADRN
ncbi:uncharacterized protein LOC106013323 [Aplysia californica]|uniref:Uncharacterized protein LOC106013323 n=1 Tax=Aplysia californica TaxID=6500 RepID=A0ABM1AAV3_APLCA|nr:uncharacterized protein LOC106013323 [Aplysia californica]